MGGGDQSEQIKPPPEDPSFDDQEPPLLYLDINIGPRVTTRLVFYSGDDSKEVATRFVHENSKLELSNIFAELDESKKMKLLMAINTHLT